MSTEEYLQGFSFWTWAKCTTGLQAFRAKVELMADRAVKTQRIRLQCFLTTSSNKTQEGSLKLSSKGYQCHILQFSKCRHRSVARSWWLIYVYIALIVSGECQPETDPVLEFSSGLNRLQTFMFLCADLLTLSNYPKRQRYHFVLREIWTCCIGGGLMRGYFTVYM